MKNVEKEIKKLQESWKAGQTGMSIYKYYFIKKKVVLVNK